MDAHVRTAGIRGCYFLGLSPQLPDPLPFGKYPLKQGSWPPTKGSETFQDLPLLSSPELGAQHLLDSGPQNSEVCSAGPSFLPKRPSTKLAESWPSRAPLCWRPGLPTHDQSVLVAGRGGNQAHLQTHPPPASIGLGPEPRPHRKTKQVMLPALCCPPDPKRGRPHGEANREPCPPW